MRKIPNKNIKKKKTNYRDKNEEKTQRKDVR
jgi:hypothetical protein